MKILCVQQCHHFSSDFYGYDRMRFQFVLKIDLGLLCNFLLVFSIFQVLQDLNLQWGQTYESLLHANKECGIKIEGNNKWLKLIQNASYQPDVSKRISNSTL